MVINTNEIVNLAAEVSRIRGLRATFYSSVRGGLLTGASTFVGGMLLGPIGLAIGGTAGGISSMFLNRDYRSVADIILNDLSTAQKAMLANRVQNIIQDLRVEDASLLLPLVLGDAMLGERILAGITTFINNDLHMMLEN